ncbi:MAG: hypothetical protein IKO61_11490 [Lachnospiraceae bacterium]|nr:hypothetical protein [Lachnospiraceae bacterium]
MRIVELTNDNVDDYEGCLDSDLLDNIGREYHGGAVALKEKADDVSAALFWNLKNVETENEDTINEILNLSSADSECGDEILCFFDEKNNSCGAKKAVFEFAELDKELQGLLEKDGFDIHKAESRDIIVSLGDMAGLKAMRKKTPEYVKSLSDITVRQFKTGIMACVLRGRYGLLDDLPFLPMTWFDAERSSCVVTDAKVNGLLLVREVDEGVYRVELLFAMQPDANINLLNMIRHSIQAAIKHGSPEDRIILRRHSSASNALIGHMFPGRKGEQVVRGEKSYG